VIIEYVNGNKEKTNTEFADGKKIKEQVIIEYVNGNKEKTNTEFADGKKINEQVIIEYVNGGKEQIDRQFTDGKKIKEEVIIEYVNGGKEEIIKEFDPNTEKLITKKIITKDGNGDVKKQQIVVCTYDTNTKKLTNKKIDVIFKDNNNKYKKTLLIEFNDQEKAVKEYQNINGEYFIKATQTYNDDNNMKEKIICEYDKQHILIRSRKTSYNLQDKITTEITSGDGCEKEEIVSEYQDTDLKQLIKKTIVTQNDSYTKTGVAQYRDSVIIEAEVTIEYIKHAHIKKVVREYEFISDDTEAKKCETIIYKNGDQKKTHTKYTKQHILPDKNTEIGLDISEIPCVNNKENSIFANDHGSSKLGFSDKLKTALEQFHTDKEMLNLLLSKENSLNESKLIEGEESIQEILILLDNIDLQKENSLKLEDKLVTEGNNLIPSFDSVSNISIVSGENNYNCENTAVNCEAENSKEPIPQHLSNQHTDQESPDFSALVTEKSNEMDNNGWNFTFAIDVEDKLDSQSSNIKCRRDENIFCINEGTQSDSRSIEEGKSIKEKDDRGNDRQLMMDFKKNSQSNLNFSLNPNAEKGRFSTFNNLNKNKASIKEEQSLSGSCIEETKRNHEKFDKFSNRYAKKKKYMRSQFSFHTEEDNITSFENEHVD
ncbi:MAG: hypothetical protein AAFO15_02640, partial [Pseudomonadota bacterium]